VDAIDGRQRKDMAAFEDRKRQAEATAEKARRKIESARAIGKAIGDAMRAR